MLPESQALARETQPTIALRCRSETENFILEDLFRSVLPQLIKHNPSGIMKLDNLSISQSLKLHISMGKNPSNFSKTKFHSKYFGLLWVDLKMTCARSVDGTHKVEN